MNLWVLFMELMNVRVDFMIFFFYLILFIGEVFCLIGSELIFFVLLEVCLIVVVVFGSYKLDFFF